MKNSENSSSPSKYTVVMNHMITNDFELYAYSILYALILLLYCYQCYKIHIYYSNYSDETRAYRQFEILFAIATLLRIVQIEYSLMGYFIDGHQTLIDGKQIYFCDPEFIFSHEFKCYSNYKAYAIFSSLSFIVFNILVQSISMFWLTQISPQSVFFRPQKRINKGIEYYFFMILNITQLILYIIAYYQSYKNVIMSVLKIYEAASCGLTFIYFLISFRKYYIENKNQKDHIVISIGILFCIITKIVYIAYRFIQSGHSNNVEKEYEKNTFMQPKLSYAGSALIFSMVIVDQVIFRVLIVKLF